MHDAYYLQYNMSQEGGRFLFMLQDKEMGGFDNHFEAPEL